MRISDWSSDVCSSDLVAPVHRGGGKNVTPKFLYGGADIRGALTDMAGHDGDPYEGVQIELVNPMTAGPVFPTLSYRAQLLRSGQTTAPFRHAASQLRSEEHPSELQSLMRISYAVFCLKKKNRQLPLTSHSYSFTLYPYFYI